MRSSSDLVSLVGAQPGIHEVPLEVARTSTVYRKQLHEALMLLRDWVTRSRWADVNWEFDASVASQVLCEHVQWLRDAGRSIANARHAVLSAQTATRSLRGHITRAWDCIKSWQLQRPLKSRVPMPHIVLQGFFAMAIALALG